MAICSTNAAPLLCLHLLWHLIVTILVAGDEPKVFSGFYMPDISNNFEPFASAWLISRQKFVSSVDGFAAISNFEGTVFSVLGRGRATKKKAIMTRDYFDFQVEHLSSTLNTLEDAALLPLLVQRLTRRAESLRSSIVGSKSSRPPPPALTVAIVPFSTQSAHTGDEAAMQVRIRMFLVTFWSLKRYNFDVVVSVSSQHDLAILQQLQLPVFRTYSFFDLARKSEQPKRSLLQAVSDIQNDPSWQHFNFVYYSDADQILHMRNLNIIYATLLLDFHFVLCPHRLHTLALPKDLPKTFRDKKHFTIENLIAHTQAASLILEKSTSSRGSCCDDGRYVVTNSSVCSNFWFLCEQLHAYTLAEWVKFGPQGLPAPLTTEHLGRCRYFPRRRLCDLPKDCQQQQALSPIPLASDGSAICGEISKIHKF